MTENDNLPILPIPQVPTHWFSGNIPDIDPGFRAKSFWDFAELYGPIYQMNLGGPPTIVVSSYAFFKQIIDDEEFEKKVSSSNVELRALLGDGLFTAYSEEQNWWKAHRILMPVFGPLSVKKMFDQQLDIASQMVLRWDHFGPDNEILCSDDFTRLAFDTIALCAFNHRFNEFYADNPHIFATQMADTLIASGKRAIRSKIENALRLQEDRKFWNDIAAQHKICDDIVNERIKHPKPEVNDLLNTMLNTQDPVTGEKLSAENIRYQMATFLVAGHETTSGTLAFFFYHLLKNPETYHKAQQEVDEVLGTNAITLDHLPKLKYIDAALKETLRYDGPITILSRHAKKDTIISDENGRYKVNSDQYLTLNMKGIHRDPKVWGDDVNQFKPERMFDFSNIPEGAWRPFGIGLRSCIGRAFAEQEMLINIALILQRFQVEMADPTYTLEYLPTATVKPKNFRLKVRRRPGRSIHIGLYNGEKALLPTKQAHFESVSKAMTVLYGSNAGSCQAYAEEFAARTAQYGYHCKVKTMDAAVESLPTDQPIAIITPSYEGKPADNAKKFVAWLKYNKDSNMLKGVRYFVFGVGNKEWAQTYQKVPKEVDLYMQSMGAERIIQAREVDVASDTLGPFDDWCDEVQKVLGGNDKKPEKGLTATVTKGNSAGTPAEFNNSFGLVKENIDIADNSVGPVKMHMEVELQEDVSYRTGDYLSILPTNHRDDVRRILTRFELHPDDTVMITDTRKEFLKSENPVTVYDLLSTRVELATPITQRQLKAVMNTTKDENERNAIAKMAETQWDDTLRKRFSVIDILEDYPHCKLDFGAYLDMLMPMTPRQYSISSTMLAQRFGTVKATATITYDVYQASALSGHGRTFHGVASSYLADLKPGNAVRCAIRSTNANFHLPEDVTVPVIMIASGTGMAPMRGFIQERAAIQQARGIKLGPALFYFGCRDFEKDYIYKAQLEEWENQGVVSMRPCFSQRGPDADSFKYTSDRIYAEKAEVNELFKKGAKIFICGSASKIARSTAEVCIRLHMEGNSGVTRAQAEEWLDGIKEDRYVSDVFG